MEIKNQFFETEGTAQLQKLKEMELPITQTFNVIKILKKVEDSAKDYFEAKGKLLKKYGKEDEKQPGRFEILKENIENFNKEISELLELKIELNGLKKVQLTSDTKVSAQFLMHLEEFVEVKEE